MLLAFAWLACTGAIHTAGAAEEDPAHAELRALRTEVIDAITKGDFERVLKNVHPNVVITWQTNDICRGHKELTDFFNKRGKDAFKGYHVPPTPDDLTILYGGDTGISFGHTVARYTLLGKDIDMTSRWTATLVKENGKWLLAGYHVSSNLIDNPLLNAAKTGLYVAGGVALLVGLVVGVLIGKRRKATV
jgi:ketosteroid isomerase-like protein